MPQDEPPHAEMIAAVKRQIERHEALLWTHNLPNATREDDEAAEFERAELERLRAVLAHLERTQWRDIEEAPKDGSHILTYNTTPVHDQDTRRTSIEHRISVSYWCFGGWMEYPASPRFIQGQVHTHWMPLPPSPETPK
jgi:hypothetical protein